MEAMALEAACHSHLSHDTDLISQKQLSLSHSCPAGLSFRRTALEDQAVQSLVKNRADRLDEVSSSSGRFHGGNIDEGNRLPIHTSRMIVNAILSPMQERNLSAALGRQVRSRTL